MQVFGTESFWQKCKQTDYQLPLFLSNCYSDDLKLTVKIISAGIMALLTITAFNEKSTS
jgi:hypothetical protein